mgnify:CR=1 FL=1
MNTITPAAAQDLLANGVTLVDIRSADEYAREHIAGAQRLGVAALQAEQFTAPVIFHCRLGQRTRQQAARLRASAGDDSASAAMPAAPTPAPFRICRRPDTLPSGTASRERDMT